VDCREGVYSFILYNFKEVMNEVKLGGGDYTKLIYERLTPNMDYLKWLNYIEFRVLNFHSLESISCEISLQ
jgi:hypothetical protein